MLPDRLIVASPFLFPLVKLDFPIGGVQERMASAAAACRSIPLS
jgi:hypothetical protein